MKTIPEEKLPILVTAWTACFRSEAGAAGKDTRGILRQHQFQKSSSSSSTHPEKVTKSTRRSHENAESILQKTWLHYRTMLLSTGDMGFASAKTYDLEVWLPSSNEFREILSCSNCEAFQSRRAWWVLSLAVIHSGGTRMSVIHRRLIYGIYGSRSYAPCDRIVRISAKPMAPSCSGRFCARY